IHRPPSGAFGTRERSTRGFFGYGLSTTTTLGARASCCRFRSRVGLVRALRVSPSGSWGFVMTRSFGALIFFNPSDWCDIDDQSTPQIRDRIPVAGHLREEVWGTGRESPPGAPGVLGGAPVRKTRSHPGGHLTDPDDGGRQDHQA